MRKSSKRNKMKEIKEVGKIGEDTRSSPTSKCYINLLIYDT